GCPWPGGRTQPMITSCTWSGRMPARSTAARMAAAPSSGAAKPFSSPWNAPMGVRATETITIGSFCIEISFRRGSARQLVGTHEAACAFGELHREWTGLAGLAVDLHAGEDADRGNLSGRGVVHLVHELGRALADLEEGGAHRDGVAGEELAPVGDVVLHGRHAALVVFQGGRGDTDGVADDARPRVGLAQGPQYVHAA